MRAFLIWLLLCTSAFAQQISPGIGRGQSNEIRSGISSQSYVGLGDIQAGAEDYWGLRGYDAAYSSRAANVCTPLDAVCADVNILNGDFNLAGTPSLTCNNAGSICTVKVLYTQSRRLNCTGSACDVSNAVIATRPTLAVPGAANGCTSTSSYCMLFSGTQWLANTANYNGTCNQPFTQTGVAINTGNFGANQAILANNDFTTLLFFNAGAIIGAYAGNGITVAAASSTWHTTAALFNGASSNVYADGVAGTTGDVGAQVFNSTGIGIGAFPAGAATQLTGGISETGHWCSNVISKVGAFNSNQRAYWRF